MEEAKIFEGSGNIREPAARFVAVTDYARSNKINKCVNFLNTVLKNCRPGGQKELRKIQIPAAVVITLTHPPTSPQ